MKGNDVTVPMKVAVEPAAPRTSQSSRRECAGSRFLLGAIRGYETGPRVGQALGGLDMLSRGWHSGVVFGTLSAAVSAGALYGIDPARFEDALRDCRYAVLWADGGTVRIDGQTHATTVSPLATARLLLR